MTLDGLIAALRAGRGILPPSEYIQKIQKRGVSFEVTAGVERQLRQAGATTEIVQAARGNYRGERTQPHPSPAPEHEQQPASLLVICDLACNWKLDGKEQGRIEAGGSAKAKVVLGQHIVQAVTEDGADRVKQFSEVKASGQTVASIELQPVRDARLKAEQAAQEQAAREQVARKIQPPLDPNVASEIQAEVQQADAAERDMAENEQAEKWTSNGDALSHKDRYAEALPYYQKACDDGKAVACNRLGLIYGGRHTGVAHDEARAAALFKKACDGGEALGCNNLATDYQYGIGVPKDAAKARELLQKSCRMGSQQGCDWLKEMQ